MAMTGGAGATEDDGRRRPYNMLDSAYPDRGYALRWCKQALGMYKADGDMKQVRLLLRSALGCNSVVDYASVYKAWIAMELNDDNVVAPRALFLEWGHRIYAGEEDSGVDFWCMFINFEVKNGGAEHARAVAKAAVEACPTDPTLYTKNLKVEMLFGHGHHASHDVLGRHLDNFAMDVDCKDWLVHYQVGASHDHGDDHSKVKRLPVRSFLGRMCRGIRRLVHPHGYKPVHASSTTSLISV